ncbi:MAG: hypothetical protein A2655_00900 [Candidatus Yanofskybacteria bacterium RIFCSPHIGHO2_01_FULL_43_42]|uniref:DUF4446 domain-containing protein n=1 Tax=Candidatus Taylorbacteria bacterium RIFCSPLOWO2_01_FULL_45_15b TaxID=1802319 RepID=A0A1G2NDT8_9BACT|nr:MAG: hypothetical protein A2655_00900 [Candidatus Yanofskybacteria bacterium RIFCSPHIGHO2_01_FULL_43_42]OHA34203.1 MAG: hypothetical protein A2928_04775 [Candidatus Taylorbacteria bacterium RIFCSPLOWO2_01_FULL_45_15b]
MEIPFDVLSYVLAITIIVLIVWIIRLEIRIARLLSGKDGKSLESVISSINAGWIESRGFQNEMEKYLTGVEKRLSKSLRTCETVHFNAFRGNGESGNQSFATAYVNEIGDGVIISSLYARERTSIFSKPIKRWVSDTPLSPEEKEVLAKAKLAVQN